MNRDNAETARDVGEAALRAGDHAKALRMFLKSKQLFPLDGIDARIAAARAGSQPSNNHQHQHQSSSSSSSSSTPPSSSSASTSSRSASAPASSSASSTADVAPEHIESVRRIVETTCYYEVLQVKKGDITELELKKAYRKVALRVHPDKNKAPGAEEAFKKVGEAFSVLSDPQKKQIYDVHGAEGVRSTPQHNPFGGGGAGGPGMHFGGDNLTPEELFEFLFTGRAPRRRNGMQQRGGGGFPAGAQFHFGGGGSPFMFHQQRRAHPQAHAQGAANEPSWRPLLQLLPMLFLFLAFLMNASWSSPAFSLHRTHNYPTQRVTEHTNIKLPYFVPTKFDVSKVRDVEKQVRQAYHDECYNEVHTLRRLMRRDWRGNLYHTPRSNSFPTPYCEALGIKADSAQI